MASRELAMGAEVAVVVFGSARRAGAPAKARVLVVPATILNWEWNLLAPPLAMPSCAT